MSEPTRLALIHATRIAVNPIVSACHTYWPEVEPVSILDESLAIDRNKDKHLSDELSNRIIALGRYAEGIRSAGILYTCSAFGAAIEQVALSSSIPVLKPNSAMFEKAFSLGERVVMIYTFLPSVPGMEKEFRDEAQARGSSASIRSVFAEGARQAAELGDIETHNRIITSSVASVEGADVIVLAHFSMATAAPDAANATDIPVLNSPETAIEKIKSQIANKQEA